MAKELPYFKFEPSEWDNGTIQMLDRSDKGLFIDLCCMYWSRLGVVPFKLAVHKLCNSNASALQVLCNEGIIDIENDQIVIKFLDEQLNEFQETSKKRSIAANKRWKNASAMQVQSNSNAIREDKIKEEKKREEDNRGSAPKKSTSFKKPEFNILYDYFFEKIQNQEIAKKEAQAFWNHYEANGWMVGKNKMKKWKAAVSGWISRMDNFKKLENGKGKQTSIEARVLANSVEAVQRLKEQRKL